MKRNRESSGKPAAFFVQNAIKDVFVGQIVGQKPEKPHSVKVFIKKTLFCRIFFIRWTMNIVILFLLIAGIGVSLFCGTGEGVLTALQKGAAEAIETVLRLSGAYLLWLGLLNVAERAGLIKTLSRLLSSVLALLFPNAGSAREAISLNLAANMLGMGNAATPYGLAAMRLLNEANPHPGAATNEMCVLLVINASCLELFPAALVGMRTSFGSKSPFAVVLPTLLSSLAATVVAVALCLVFTRPCRSRS